MRVLALLSLLFLCSCGSGDGNGGEIGPGEMGRGNGDPCWVSVGQNGHVFYSEDGIDWHQGVNPNPETLYSVSNDGHNFWVAVGINTAVYSSDSGRTWTKSTSPIVKELYGLTNDGQGRWGAVGFNGAFYGSLDGGKNWSAPDEDKHFTTTGVRDVATDGTNWVAVGQSGHNGHTTAAFDTWLAGEVTDPAMALESVATDGQLWVAVGSLGRVQFSEDNGKTWTIGTGDATRDLREVATDGANNWVAVGGPLGTQTSSNGLDWQASPIPPQEILEGLDRDDDNLWIGVGGNGAVYSSEDNGATWVVGQKLEDSASEEFPSQYSVVWGQ